MLDAKIKELKDIAKAEHAHAMKFPLHGNYE